MTQQLNSVANAAKIQKESFVAMCNEIAANYNTITGENLQYRNQQTYYRSGKDDTVLQRLFTKMEHIAFDLYSPQSLPDFLTRIAIKPIKVISKPEYQFNGLPFEQEETYGKGHFRWDWKAYTLNDAELQAIRQYLNIEPKQKTQPFMNEKGKEKFENLSYNWKAKYLLNRTSTTFTATFKEHGSMPWDKDGVTRDIFTIVLKNKQHRYRLTFGQSLNNSTGNGNNVPTEYDVLASLTKHNPGTFKDFCSEFGYDEDSRSAYKTYKAVMKEYHNLARLFTPEQMELLQEIQ